MFSVDQCGLIFPLALEAPSLFLKFDASVEAMTVSLQLKITSLEVYIKCTCSTLQNSA